jgi:hypothetical protein
MSTPPEPTFGTLLRRARRAAGLSSHIVSKASYCIKVPLLDLVAARLLDSQHQLGACVRMYSPFQQPGERSNDSHA